MTVPPARPLALLLSLAFIGLTPGCRCTQQDQLPDPDDPDQPGHAARPAPPRHDPPEQKPRPGEPRPTPATGEAPRRSWYKAHKEILYHKAMEQELRLDLFIPTESPRPLATILFLHGGGWHKGSKEACPVESLLADGFAVACANYRLSGVAPFPAQLHDVRAAVRWLRKAGPRYALDSEQIGAYGMSAGAHLAAMLGTASDVKELRQQQDEDPRRHRVQAVAAWFPPTDFLSVDYPSHMEYADAVVRLLRLPNIKALEGVAPLARLASPLYHVTPDDAPVLLMHGTRDTVVPVTQSIALHRALVKAGVRAEYRELPGATHGGGFGQAQEVEVRNFFREHLRRDKAARVTKPTR